MDSPKTSLRLKDLVHHGKKRKAFNAGFPIVIAPLLVHYVASSSTST